MRASMFKVYKRLPQRLRRRTGRAIRRGVIDKKLYKANDFANCVLKRKNDGRSEKI